jgi:hypothetical protein
MVDRTPTLWDFWNWKSMGWLFIEFPGFNEVRDEYFLSDDQFACFQESLVRNPEQGEVIQGCGGLRKARWMDPRRGKGKRGGLRVIYLLVPEVHVVVLVDVYDKNEADDLTAKEKKEVAHLARETKNELVKRLAEKKG